MARRYEDERNDPRWEALLPPPVRWPECELALELMANVSDPRPDHQPYSALVAQEEGDSADVRSLTLARMIAELPPRERRVVRWHYGLDDEPLTMAEIAERLGVCRRTATEIKRQALAILRGDLRRDDIRRAA